MATQVYVGASGLEPNGHGLYRRSVDGDGWQRLAGGLPPDSQVRAIAVHPSDTQIIYAGTQYGPYRSSDGGGRWTALPLPDPDMVVWSLLIGSEHPDVVFVGTAPAAVYRSDDAGHTWRRLRGFSAPGRVPAPFPTRVIRLVEDPTNPREFYAGLEIDGIVHSADGGETWQDLSAPLVKLSEREHLKSRIVSDLDSEGILDSHALCLSGAAPGTVFLAARVGLFRSADRGATWEDMEIGRFSPRSYARDVKVSPHDGRRLYACLSPAAVSEEGSLYESDDLGLTWKRIDQGINAHSTMMVVALNPKDPGQIFCAARHGQAFGTLDGGATWQEWPLPEGTRDIYALACA